jgi:CRP-like cAMP-binding protein
MIMNEPVDMDVKRSFIKKQAVFTQLTEEERDVLASLLHEKHFSPGDTIVVEGDPVDSVYFIVSGNADVRHVSIQNGETHIDSIATLNPGIAVGLNETGFYSVSGVRTATVVALTDLVALRLSVAAFHGFSLANSHVSEVMRKNAASILGFSNPTTEDKP